MTFSNEATIVLYFLAILWCAVTDPEGYFFESMVFYQTSLIPPHLFRKRQYLFTFYCAPLPNIQIQHTTHYVK